MSSDDGRAEVGALSISRRFCCMTLSAIRARRNMSSLCNKLCGTIVSEEFPTGGFVSFLMKKNNTKSKHNDSVENPWGIGLNFRDEFFVNNHISD